MTEYVKVEKIIPKFPPPAFSDIAKASNDVCFGSPRRASHGAIANGAAPSLSTRTSTTLPQVRDTN
jgi:voltage-dependent anion channel protein 2